MLYIFYMQNICVHRITIFGAFISAFAYCLDVMYADVFIKDKSIKDIFTEKLICFEILVKKEVYGELRVLFFINIGPTMESFCRRNFW